MPHAVAEDPIDFGPHTRLELFALEYLKDLNARRAALRAGYAEGTARTSAPRLLDHPVVQATLARELAARKERLGVEAEFILRELLALASADLAEAFDANGNLKPIQEIPLEVRKAIAGVEVFEEFQGRGEAREQIGNTRKVKFWDRLKALELLGKYHKLFADTLDVNVKGDLGARILQARRRGTRPEPGEDLV